MASNNRVQGAVFSSDEKGFEQLLVACNQAADRGKQILGVIPLGTGKIGAIFLQQEPKSSSISFDE